MAADEEMVLEVAEEIPQSLGFEVLTAGDGSKAVELFREHRDAISCVLLDLTMPRMDGVETFHQLRDINPDVRVIVCSGYLVEQVTKRFSGVLPAGFLQKPFSLADLSAKMQEVLQG